MNQSVESLSDVADGQLFDITDRMEMVKMMNTVPVSSKQKR